MKEIKEHWHKAGPPWLLKDKDIKKMVDQLASSNENTIGVSKMRNKTIESQETRNNRKRMNTNNQTREEITPIKSYQ